jgi:hypothetical protein
LSIAPVQWRVVRMIDLLRDHGQRFEEERR